MKQDLKQAYDEDTTTIIMMFVHVLKLYDLHHGSVWRRVRTRLWMWWREHT